MNPRLLDRLKSLPLTIILTILIWMYAEAQFASSEEGLTVLPRVVSRDPESAARIVTPADGAFRITVEGSRGQVERFRQQSLGALAFSESDQRALVYYIDSKTSQPLELPSVQLLNALPFFRRNGLTVTAAAPATVQLDVDHLKHFERPVEWRGDIAATVSPSTVDVVMPQRLFDAIGAENKIIVTAAPTQELAAPAVGQTATVPATFSLEYPGDQDARATITPASGTATLRPTQPNEATLTIHDVPVLVSGSPEMISRSAITIDPKAVTVRLAGRDDALKSLRRLVINHQPAMRVYLDIDDGDKFGAGPVRRALRYVLPEGVTVAEGPQTVSFSLEHVGKPVDEAK
jgi:hypothetical protein